MHKLALIQIDRSLRWWQMAHKRTDQLFAAGLLLTAKRLFTNAR